VLLDADTVVRIPHSDTDPRVSIEMQEEDATLALFFDPGRALAGDAPVVEVRITPTEGGEFRPWTLIPKLPLHLQYARATLAFRGGDAGAALRALAEVDKTRRGTSAIKLRIVAHVYSSLVSEGEPYPNKALAAALHADESTASRWVKAARERGFLPKDES
jgi:hypothetical protein